MPAKVAAIAAASAKGRSVYCAVCTALRGTDSCRAARTPHTKRPARGTYICAASAVCVCVCVYTMTPRVCMRFRMLVRLLVYPGVADR